MNRAQRKLHDQQLGFAALTALGAKKPYLGGCETAPKFNKLKMKREEVERPDWVDTDYLHPLPLVQDVFP